MRDAGRPIELWAYDTPNARKISVALEEMALPYVVRVVDLRSGEQHAPAFLRISPSDRLPAIVDPDGPENRPISAFRVRRDPPVPRPEGRTIPAVRPRGAGPRAGMADAGGQIC